MDEKGVAYCVTDGLLRANFAKLAPNEDILPPGSGIDILPNLPWHGFKESDYVDRILAGGKKVKLVIDLLPTSWVFKKGHRIRVSIAGADWPTFQLHPKLSPTNNPNDQNNIVPAITVCHRDGRYEGSTELYTFRDDVYLPYEDQWLRWKTKKNWERGSVEIYKCEGEPGK